MIALIDYGSGNLRSVSRALTHEGAAVRLVDSPEGLAEADAVVLPGVGAFGDCVQNLRARGLWGPIRSWLAADKPFLGICVGYQMLFDSSEEAPGETGLGFLKGRVKRFDSAGLKIPQIGWNTLQFDRPDDRLWRGLPEAPHVYFVHSYFPKPEDPSIVTSHTIYGESFAASITSGRVSAVQFHPEKSQDVGLTILRNFIDSVPALV
jgi:glutamine amidotransferase